MKKLILINFLIFSIFYLNSFVAMAQMATLSEASAVAGNWITLVVAERGTWGNNPSATAEPMQSLYFNNKTIGYYCQVQPAGFIVVSLRKELSPVKAYSVYSLFDTSSMEGISWLIRKKMALILDTIEKQLGPVELDTIQDLKSIIDINYCDAWNNLLSNNPEKSNKKVKPSGSGKNNYQEGEILLLGNNWHQHPPFNELCPDLNCTTTSNGRAFVGCVATAGAQIMYHWSWPPYGVGAGYSDSYDWENMPDAVTYSSPQAAINAVAELGYEVATAVNMDFGCDGSGAAITNMEGVFQSTYYYSINCNVAWRSNYTQLAWFDLLKNQFNMNRPVEYGIIGHAIVGDGWQEIGSPVIRQYHMNWGFTGTGSDTWYTLDELPEGSIDIEHVVKDISPTVALGSTVSGTYSKPTFTYRYFDRDCSGTSATFNVGHKLQFLENIEVTGTGTSTYVRFNGSTTEYTRLFTGGDMNHGILITNGAIRLKNSGSIRLQ